MGFHSMGSDKTAPISRRCGVHCGWQDLPDRVQIYIASKEARQIACEHVIRNTKGRIGKIHLHI